MSREARAHRAGRLSALMSMPPAHPDWIDPHADLVVVDGNAFAVMGFVARKLREAGNSREVVDAYYREAMAADYDHLLAVSMSYAGMA